MITIDQINELRQCAQHRMQEYLSAIDRVAELVTSPNLQESEAKLKVAKTRNPRRLSPRGSAHKGQVVRQEPVGAIRAAIRQAMEAVSSPFTMQEIRAWLKEHNRTIFARMGASTLSGTIFRMHAGGALVKSGSKAGLQAYKLAEPKLPPKEVAYRELRASMNIPQPTD